MDSAVAAAVVAFLTNVRGMFSDQPTRLSVTPVRIGQGQVDLRLHRRAMAPPIALWLLNPGHGCAGPSADVGRQTGEAEGPP